MKRKEGEGGASLRLAKVIGFTHTTPASHPSQPGLLAYTAGNIVVLYDSNSRKQVRFFLAKGAVSCVAFSRSGLYLAGGGDGTSPEISIWDVKNGQQVQALKGGHKYGVSSVGFSGDGKLLLSCGASYDGQLCLWEWSSGLLLGKQHTQCEVQCAAVSEDGTSVISLGKDGGQFKVIISRARACVCVCVCVCVRAHCVCVHALCVCVVCAAVSLCVPLCAPPPAPCMRPQVWHMGQSSFKAKGAAGSVVLTTRICNLKEHRNSQFAGIAAAPGGSGVYALTRAGTLLLLRANGRGFEKSVSLQVSICRLGWRPREKPSIHLSIHYRVCQ